jgi:hypothetical protein
MPLPAGDEIFVPAGNEPYGDPPVDVGPLYVPTDDYEVMSVNQTTREPQDGRIIPTLEVGFYVPGMGGAHSILIDNYAFTHADVLSYMRGRAARLRRIMALPEVLPPDPEEV